MSGGAQTDDLIAERFRVIRELGRGGMGAVFLVHDEYLNEEKALKIATAGGMAHDEFARRFEREARIGGLLGQETGFVRTYAWGELEDSSLYAAMDVVEGATDLDLLEGTRDERLRRLLRVGELIARAHAKGVIHRDLKPANVFVDVRGELWLGDFGLSKHTDESDTELDLMTLTHTGAAMGTPYFMPPEQFEDAKSVDRLADIYALGVMLFFALTGEYPYKGSSPARLLASQLKVRMGSLPEPRVRDRKPNTPLALDTLCARAMAMDPRSRLSTADEFVTTLAAFLERSSSSSETVPAALPVGTPVDGGGAATRPASALAKTVPELPTGAEIPEAPNRRPVAVLGGVAIALTLVGGLGVGVFATGRRSQVSQAAPAELDEGEVSVYERAAMGEPAALLELATLADQEGDREEAFRLREDAALQGDTGAMMSVADMHLRGYGVEKSLELSQAWFEKAADAGESRGTERAAFIESLLAKREAAEEREAKKRAATAEWRRDHGVDTGMHPAAVRAKRKSDHRKELEARQAEKRARYARYKRERAEAAEERKQRAKEWHALNLERAKQQMRLEAEREKERLAAQRRWEEERREAREAAEAQRARFRKALEERARGDSPRRRRLRTPRSR